MTSIGTCRAPDRTEDHGMANDLGWRKARRSNDHGGACVELAALTEGVGVRDSKNPDGPKLVLTLTTFRTLLTDLKQQ